MGTRTLLTVEQFAQMETADTEDYELVEGELVPLSSGTPLHNIVRYRMETLLFTYLERTGLGLAISEIDCRLGESTVRRPDVAVFLGERVREIDPNKIPVPFAPNIAVEVLSASERAIDVNRKVRDYLRAGCTEVWLLDPANVELFAHSSTGIRLLSAKDILEPDLLPGFSAPVARLLGPV